MASATYEKILREVEQLSDDEQGRLLETLKRRSSEAPDPIRALRESSEHLTPPTPAQRDAIDAWFARVDMLADEVSAAWIDPSISAVEAVREQRREL